MSGTSKRLNFVVTALALCVTCGAQTAALQVGHPIEFQLIGTEPKVFSVDLQAGQYLRGRVVCAGYSVAASIKSLSSVTSLGGTGGAAIFATVADVARVYLIKVKATPFQNGNARCVVEVIALREATVADRADAAAHLAFATPPRDYSRVDTLARSAGDVDMERLNAIARGRALNGAKKYQDARELMKESELIAPNSPDHRSEAAMHYASGLAAIYLEDNRSAIQEFEAALSLQRGAGQTSESAITLHNLSVAHWSLGECREALEGAQGALDLRHRIGDRTGEGYTLLAIAKDHLCLGDSQQALDTYNTVLPLWRELGNEQQAAAVLNDLGVLYVRLGDYPQAGACHKQALEIRRKLKDSAGEAESLNNVGQLKQNLADFPAALAAYQEALRLQRANHFTRGEAYALLGEADAMASMGNHLPALPIAEQSVRLLRDSGERAGEGFAWQAVARCRLGLHQPGLAREAFEHALDLERAIGQQAEQSETLTSIASIERIEGQLERSRLHLDEALHLIERSRTGVMSPLLRTSYAAKKREAYELAAEVLMESAATSKSGDLEAAAFVISERTHARGLLDALAENEAGIREGADPALIARQKALEQELNARVDALTRVSAPERARAGAAIEQLFRRRQQLEAEIRSADPRYADLIHPQPPSRPTVQTLLPVGGVLLEYLVGEDKSYLWVIERNRFTTFQLPGRKPIESVVKKLYECITARNHLDIHETLAARQKRLSMSDTEAARLIARLRSVLLPPGALPPGSGLSTILVVPDDALHFVPFNALWPRYKVVLLPSAATLKELSRPGGVSHSLSPLLLIGDPVFGADDERVRKSGHAPAMSGAQTRLRNSRREVEQIARLASPAESVTALDFDAAPAALKREDLSRFGVIHIASHALLNPSHPEFSGIALSATDREGRATAGFVRLHEIYNLRLRAGLVTLSACSTALGQDVKGEGLASLARGFLYAGTSRVLASLWNVDDETTAEFMSRFYRNVYRRNMAPAAALHSTANEMRQNPQWKAPYYWAAFTLQGDPE